MRAVVIGVGHLGKHHVRILASLPGVTLAGVVDTDMERAGQVAAEHGIRAYADVAQVPGTIDVAVVAVPTESHARIAQGLIESGIHTLVEKPITQTLAEADALIAAATSRAVVLAVGHSERFNPAVAAARPHLNDPRFIEVHRLGQPPGRSLDIDVVRDLMIHDLDIVQTLVGADLEATDVRAVGIPVLTGTVDAANARIEFASGAVANITASRVGMEKIRKMRFFQPHDYVAVDFVTRYAAITSLAPEAGEESRPGVSFRRLEVEDTEPLRAEIESFLAAAETGEPPPVTGADGRRALSLALRVLGSIHEHDTRTGINALKPRSSSGQD